MVSQILLLVIATAASVNAYPHGPELANDLATFLGELKVKLFLLNVLCSYVRLIIIVKFLQSAKMSQKVNAQQSLSLCSSFPFSLTFNGVTYEFRDCFGKMHYATDVLDCNLFFPLHFV